MIIGNILDIKIQLTFAKYIKMITSRLWNNSDKILMW